MRKKYFCVAWFVLHFLVIVSVSCRDTLRSVAEGPTILPRWSKDFSQKAEAIASVALGQDLAVSNPVRQVLATYLHVAGIESGYGYFAPNVPGTYKLTFELHYPDGRIEYARPQVSSTAAALRLTGLLDQIGRTKYDALKEILVKMLTQSVWREHHDVKTIRAEFGSISLPSLTEFQQGKRESYQTLYTYDFSLAQGP